MKHAIEWYEKNNIYFDYACCIYPTSVFLDQKYLKIGFKKLSKSKNKMFAISVTNYSHPLERALKIKNGEIKALWPKNLKKRTQDLQKIYYDAGQFYWGKSIGFKKKLEPLSSYSIPIIIPKILAQDIDSYDDLKKAQLLYKHIIKNEK